MNKSSRMVFYTAAGFAFLALVFGLVILFGSRLPEGVLIIGLGFCIFGTAGLFTTIGMEPGEPVPEKASKHSKKKKQTAKDAAKGYEIFLNPEGMEPVACRLTFGDGLFVADTGSESLQIHYFDIKTLRLDTPVLYIDWKDGTTWEMRFVKATAPAQVHREFQNRLSVA